MMVRRSLALLAALSLFSACSAQSDDDETAAAEATPSALPLTAHVVPADGLPGFGADSEPVAVTKAAFAEQHDKTVAELDKMGMLSGASLEFGPDDENPGTAMSIALHFSSAEQAENEAA